MDHWYDVLATLIIVGLFFWCLVTVVAAVVS
jgi:hypothetical protein